MFGVILSQKICTMIRYNSPSQLSISEFATPFEKELSKTNRWVTLAGILPWDRLASIYHKALCADFGAPCLDARIVIGSLIIKHKMSLDDRGVVEMIGENPYMQYFIGLKGFKTDPVFDPSLFVAFRKRIGDKLFDEMNVEIMRLVEQSGGKGKKGANKNHQPMQPLRKRDCWQRCRSGPGRTGPRSSG